MDDGEEINHHSSDGNYISHTNRFECQKASDVALSCRILEWDCLCGRVRRNGQRSFFPVTHNVHAYFVNGLEKGLFDDGDDTWREHSIKSITSVHVSFTETWIVFAKLISQKSYTDVPYKRTIKNTIFMEQTIKKDSEAEKEERKFSAALFTSRWRKKYSFILHTVFSTSLSSALPPSGQLLFFWFKSFYKMGGERLEISSSCYCIRKLHKIKKKEKFTFFLCYAKHTEEKWIVREI